MAKFRFWFLVYPDINKPIGGVKQIHRVAEALSLLGHEAYLVQDSFEFHPGWFRSSVNPIDKVSWDKVHLDPGTDFIVIAETFLPILKTLRPEIKKIIFNQNGSYSFGLPGSRIFKPSWLMSSYTHPSVAQVWCVSHHDFDLLVNGFNLPVSSVFLLINALEDFPPLPTLLSKKKNIVFMPRKNFLDHSVVSEMLSRQSWLHGWDIIPIQNLPHEEVISLLLDSYLFLSFGHPEGFGLPVAEAFACGCSVVGFSGLGGRELFYRSKFYNLCYEVEFGDWLGFVKGVSSIISQIENNQADWYFRSNQLSQEIREKYNTQGLMSSIDKALTALS